jgi:hypothetical protein
MFMYRLAKDLGRTVQEIMQMTTSEFMGWVAFYKFEAQEHKKATMKANARR